MLCEKSIRIITGCLLGFQGDETTTEARRYVQRRDQGASERGY